MKKVHKQDYFELAVFLMDYHSGQWSRGYRLLCRLGARSNFTSQFMQDCRETEIYQYLVSQYASKV